MDDKNIIQLIANEVERTGIDIAPTVDTFKQLVYAVANIFYDDRAEGCNTLQRLCENYHNYNKAQVAKWYASAVRQCRGNVGVGTIIKLARDAAKLVNVSIHIPTKNGTMPQAVNKSRRAHEYTPTFNYIEASTIMPYTANNHILGEYLCSLFGYAKTRAALELYYVGGTRDGRTVFPNVDENRMCVGGKVIPYLKNGHRDKSAAITNIHSIIGRTQGDQVLFGSHLLPMYPGAAVGVLEAQKTAIIMSILMPTETSNIVWVATGGKGEFNERTLKPIYQRKVIVFPDADGVELWTERTRQLPFINAVVNHWYEGEPQGSRRDIADKVADAINGNNTTSTEQLIGQLFPNNQAIINLCRLFDLEICTDADSTGQGWKWNIHKKKRARWVDRVKAV